jgi:hypothetical protein
MTMAFLHLSPDERKLYIAHSTHRDQLFRSIVITASTLS